MKKSVTILSVFLAVAAVSASAQELTLTLNDVLELGVRNSLQIAAADADVAHKSRVVDNAFNVFYPDITLSAGITHLNTSEQGAIIIPYGNPSGTPPEIGSYDRFYYQQYESNNILNTSVSGTFVLNPAMFTGLKLAKANYNAGLVSREDTEKKVTRDLKKMFYSLLLMKENLTILERSLDTMAARYRQAQENFRNGYIPELALLNTQVAYENLKPSLRQLQTAYDNTMQILKISLGIDKNADVILDGSTDIPPLDMKTLGNDREPGFDEQGISLQIRQLKLLDKVNLYQSSYPSLVLSASWSPMLANVFDSATWEDFGSSEWADTYIRDTGSVTLMLRWSVKSLFPGSSDRINRKQTQSQIELLEKQLEFQGQMNDATVENVINTLENTLGTLDSLELTVNTAKRNLELTEDAYKAGIKEILDVQTAEDELRRANQNLFSEKINYLSALFDLEYLLNETLFRQ